MSQHRNKPRDNQHNDLADRYRAGDFESDNVHEEDEETSERFSSRSKNAQQNKILRTAILRAAEETDAADLEALPIGQVAQVYSLYCEIDYAGQTMLCVVRKTLSKVSKTQMVVGDYVRFRDTGAKDEAGRSAAVIEQVLPRKTILTRTESFKGVDQHPIVANAQQMLIVASVKLPSVKWGLIDRMIAAARSGRLIPIICLNKIDLLGTAVKAAGDAADDEKIDPREALAHYSSLGITTLQTSVEPRMGVDELRNILKDRITVLAGHSGVGKSSLIRSIQPKLDIRIGEISHFTDKGRHTTSSARRYLLDFGGTVIDTPGVKMFGLWGVSQDNLIEYFPDVENQTAPAWRVQSYERILKTLKD